MLVYYFRPELGSIILLLQRRVPVHYTFISVLFSILFIFLQEHERVEPSEEHIGGVHHVIISSSLVIR
jgi:hypothetical protein